MPTSGGPGRPEVRDHALEFRSDDDARRVEDTLWWMVGRRSVLEDFLRRAERERPLRRITEIGCGSGGDLEVLARHGQVTGVERSPTLARRARARGLADEIIEQDFFDLEDRPDSDLYCLFDVLEHIEDDDGFLRRLSGSAPPGHLLLLSVPACQFLFSRHDALLHHQRRYSAAQLSDLLRANGYSVLRTTYFIFFLFPLVALARLQEKLMEALGRPPTRVRTGETPAWINALLVGILRCEAWLVRHVRLPIGVWVFALARKD